MQGEAGVQSSAMESAREGWHSAVVGGRSAKSSSVGEVTGSAEPSAGRGAATVGAR